MSKWWLTSATKKILQKIKWKIRFLFCWSGSFNLSFTVNLFTCENKIKKLTREFQNNSLRAIFLSAVGSLKQISFFKLVFWEILHISELKKCSLICLRDGADSLVVIRFFFFCVCVFFVVVFFVMRRKPTCRIISKH